MIATIVILSIAAYMLGIILTARWRYQALRPFTEPLACEHFGRTDLYATCHTHHRWCYRQSGMIDTTNEALGFALFQSLAWPFLLAWFGFGTISAHGIRRIITSGARPTMAELEAKNARLERELGITDR